MKYLDEFRDQAAIEACAKAIRAVVRQPWTIMEVCGGQTHSIVKHGLDRLLPESVTLVHGPGCPVCVTPVGIIDKALDLAARKDVIFCSFGDMLRVPGTRGDLFSVKAGGGDVRMVYSPMDALALAKRQPEKEIVFFAVGFETTAPANAMAAYQARQQNVRNFSLLVSHVLVPPAMEAILSAPKNRVQGFLAPGHVCAIVGYAEYEELARRFRVPIVVTGFEPVDILQGILLCLTQLEESRSVVENQYTRFVRRDGNETALRLLREVFTVVPRKWRGVGEISASGLALSDAFADFDAEKRFGLSPNSADESTECISGEILQGLKKPPDCPAFGTRCTPDQPLGATMVSSEGACAAYFRYRRFQQQRADA